MLYGGPPTRREGNGAESNMDYDGLAQRSQEKNASKKPRNHS